MPFETNGITYPVISNHPDVFLCYTKNQLIIAPNTPHAFKQKLIANGVNFIEGSTNVGNKYPNTALYNAVVTDDFIIHNLKITDKTILNSCKDKHQIHVNQSYTRCNLLPLKNNSFITSDKGIYNTLIKNQISVLFVNPHQIVLTGFDYGFFGGVCGVNKNSVYIMGSLSKFTDGQKVKDFLTTINYNIVELYDGKLFDCGSLIFI